MSARSRQVQEQLFDAIGRAFDIDRNHRSGRGLALFLLAFASLAWTLQAIYDLIRQYSLQLAVWGALSLFSASIVAIYLNYRKSQPVRRAGMAPLPRRGLIIALSVFRGPKESKIADLQQLGQLLVSAEAIDADLRRELLRTNWGPPLAAVEHHSAALEHLWVIVTPESRGEFGLFRQMVERCVPGRHLAVHERQIRGHSDVESMFATVNSIYMEAESHGLKPQDVIADFTSGTAAMSGGMIIATLRDDRPVEYLRQARPLVDGDRALTREEIAADMLVEVGTSLDLVDQMQTGQGTPKRAD